MTTTAIAEIKEKPEVYCDWTEAVETGSLLYCHTLFPMINLVAAVVIIPTGWELALPFFSVGLSLA